MTVTIKDVAESPRVSASTVSRAFSWLGKDPLDRTCGTQRTLGMRLTVRSSTAPPPRVSGRSNGRRRTGDRQSKGD